MPIYETSSADQIRWILADSGAVAVIVESARHRTLVDGVRDDLGELRDDLADRASGAASRAAVEQLDASASDVPRRGGATPAARPSAPTTSPR